MTDRPEPTIVPATTNRWSDVMELLGTDGEQGCYCQPWRGRDETAKANDETRPTCRGCSSASIWPRAASGS